MVEKDWSHFVANAALVMVGFLLGAFLAFSNLREHGRAIPFVSIVRVLGALVVVTGGLLVLGVEADLALLLGAVATPTAPAATADVVRADRVEGPFTRRLLGVLFAQALLPLASSGAEGGSSNYFPGAVGTFAPAHEKPKGLTLSSMALFTATEVDRAELQGRLSVSVDTLAVVDNLTALWTFDARILGATPSIGLTLPLGWAEARTSIRPAGSPTASSRFEDDTFAVGDLAAMPISLGWVFDELDLYLSLSQIVVMPTGEYDTDNLINLSRNHWSFDTLLATTWLSDTTGTEISVVHGFMGNTENRKTDYRTGAEYHFDLSVNQYLSRRFGLGLHVYTYQQLTEDEGADSLLGGFKGDSVGIGPQMFYRPSWLGDHFTFIWSWIHDLDANNRLKADHGIFQIVFTPGEGFP